MEITGLQLYLEQARAFLDLHKEFLETKSRILENHHKNMKIYKIQSLRIAEQKKRLEAIRNKEKEAAFQF